MSYKFQTLLKKTLNNFCQNTSVFLKKLFAISAEIVQCFFRNCSVGGKAG